MLSQKALLKGGDRKVRTKMNDIWTLKNMVYAKNS